MNKELSYWKLTSLHIFTRCLYFYSPQHSTTQHNIQLVWAWNWAQNLPNNTVTLHIKNVKDKSFFHLIYIFHLLLEAVPGKVQNKTKKWFIVNNTWSLKQPAQRRWGRIFLAKSFGRIFARYFDLSTFSPYFRAFLYCIFKDNVQVCILTRKILRWLFTFSKEEKLFIALWLLSRRGAKPSRERKSGFKEEISCFAKKSQIILKFLHCVVLRATGLWWYQML